MAASVIAVEWLNQNALRNYPFREDCGLRPNDSAGNLIEEGWRVPNYLVTDFVVSVNRYVYEDDPSIYMSRMSVVNGNVTLTFSDSYGNDAFVVTASVGDSSVRITGVGRFIATEGVVCFGNLSRFFEETPEGLYSFNPGESLIEPTCIRPAASGVDSIAVTDASGYTTAGIRGDIKLIAGDNINLKYDIDKRAIIISADPNSGYTAGCECDENVGRVVRSINGIRTEDVEIVGDDCVDVTTSNGVITISDTCSKPCCGCAETTFINQSINDLQSTVTTLSGNVSTLNDKVTNFVTSYLLARKTLN